MSARVEFALGPNRPNPPSDQIIQLIASAAADVLGPNARVVVTSGRENPGEQYGSNRHGTGLAADVAIYDSSNRRVQATDGVALQIALAAARRGAKGIGFGPEYMNGNNFHIDMVEPGPGQAHTWGSEGKRYREQIVAAMNGADADALFAEGGDFNDPMRQYDPLNPQAGVFANAPDFAYTQEERDLLAFYDLTRAANAAMPELIQLENLLAPRET